MDRAFVVQKHTGAQEVHWDSMFEASLVLETHRLPLPLEKVPPANN